MEVNGIRIKTGVRYMDDIRIFTHAIRAGWRWCDGTLCYCEKWRLEDEKSGMSSTARTARFIVDIMNSMKTFLNFTLEVGDDFLDRKRPTLDVKTWVKDGVIEYEFFEIPMSANTVLHRKTVMSEISKIQCLSNDMTRRILTTSLMVDQWDRDDVVDHYGQMLVNSGDNQHLTRHCGLRRTLGQNVNI